MFELFSWNYIYAGLFCGLLGALSFFLIRKKTAFLLRFFLIAWRLVFLAVLVFIVMGPFRMEKKPEEKKGSIALFIDNSLSMCLKTTGGFRLGESLERARKTIKLIEKYDYNIRIFSFNSALQEHKSLGQIKNSSEQTDMRIPLENTGTGNQDFLYSFVFTDARHSVSAELEGFLSAYAGAVPVYIVPAESRNIYRNLSINRVLHQTVSFPLEKITVSLLFSALGYQGKIKADIFENNRIIAGAVADAVYVHERIDITFPCGNEGWHHYTAKIYADNLEEISSQDNEFKFSIYSAWRPKKILYIETEAGLRPKIIRETLEDDPVFQPRIFLDIIPDERRQDRSLRSLPRSREELFAYDALIFGDSSGLYFNDREYRMCADFVEQRGGAIIFIDNNNTQQFRRYRNTPFSALYPLDVSSQVQIELAGTPQLSENARTSETLQVFSGKNPVFPQLTGIFYPGAEQAENLLVMPAKTPLPCLSLLKSGRGHTLYLDTRLLERWMRSAFSQGPHSVNEIKLFLSGIIRSIAGASITDEMFRVSPEKPLYRTGDAVKLFAGARTVGLLPDVNIEAVFNSGRRSLTASADEDTPGLFTLFFIPAADFFPVFNVYFLKDRKPAGFQPLFFSLRQENPELADLSVDWKTAGLIADKTGGKIIKNDDAMEKILIQAPHRRYIEVKKNYWNNRLMLAFLFFLLVAEWIIRRLYGLA